MCAVHTLRWLQQIAVSCKRSDYNNFFKKKKSGQSVTLRNLVRKRLQQVALLCDGARLTSSEELDFDEL